MTNAVPLPKAVDPSDLIVWYRFHAGAGSALLDSSGNGHEATIGAAQWAGYALELTAQSDVRTQDQIAGQAQLTIAGRGDN